MGNETEPERRVVFWSRAGWHEWVLWEGETIVARSGLVLRTRGAARGDLKRWLRAEEAAAVAA